MKGIPKQEKEPQVYGTLAVHSGIERGTGVGVGIPIQQMATFQFESLDAAA